MTEDVGIPHDTDTDPDDFDGTDPAADVGQPDNLGQDIGVPAAPD